MQRTTEMFLGEFSSKTVDSNSCGRPRRDLVASPRRSSSVPPRFLSDRFCKLSLLSLVRRSRPVALDITYRYLFRIMVSFDFTKEWDLSDVVLKMRDSDELLYATKTVLAAYSPFFKTLLFGPFSESKQDVVNLDGIDYWPMLEILKILHNVDRRFDEAIPLYPSDKFTQLWKTADGYDFPLIRQLCKQQIINLDPPQALETAILCEFHEEKSKILEMMSVEDMEKYLDKGGSDLVFTQADAAVMIKKYRVGQSTSRRLYTPGPLLYIDFEEKWEMSDIVLKMKDGEELFANKAILAVHSSFFKTLFFAESEKPKQEAVELKDIDFWSMYHILEVIHHVNRRFDHGGLIYAVRELVDLWKIANDYGIPLIRVLCSQQLSRLATVDALELAIKCGLHKETTEILKKMSFEDVEMYVAKGITEFVFSPADTLVIIEKHKEIEETRIAQAVQEEKIKGEEALKAEKAKRRSCRRCQTAGTFSDDRYYTR